jgi:hypothetical protein
MSRRLRKTPDLRGLGRGERLDELFFFLRRLIQLGGAINQDRGP